MINSITKISFFKTIVTTFLFYQYLCLSQLSGNNECHHHHHARTQNQLIPDLRLELDPKPITDRTALSVFGEIGRRNYRINATGGCLIKEFGCLKGSAEYLRQRLGYRFTNGLHEHWLDQVALGCGYQQRVCTDWISDVELLGYCSYAPGRHLKKIKCAHSSATVFRHIAGSNAYGGTLGMTFLPWCGASLRIDGDYDYVRYRRKHHSHKSIGGFGAGFNIFQQIYYFGLGLQADFRRPFNYYKGTLTWSDSAFCEGFTINLFCSHTRGKCRLPSSTVAGVELSYELVGLPLISSSCEEYPRCHCDPRLASWIAKTAVYVPQVLAIADEKIVRPVVVPCTSPTSTTIPTQNFCGVGTFTIATSPFFTNSSGSGPLVFSATGLPTGASINSSTGLITGTIPQNFSVFSVKVTASNSCGSTTECFAINFTCLAPTSTTLPNLTLDLGMHTIHTAQVFSSPCGQPITFSATGLSEGVSINPTTGVISGVFIVLGTFDVVVTATTSCGTTSQKFILTVD